MEWFYSVTIIRKMSSLEDGHLWSDMLPDEIFQDQFNFDGWEVTVSEDNEVQTYELFWYPKNFYLATELLGLLHGMCEHTLFEGCDYKLTVLQKDTA
jgi:hypothetical protein